MSGVISGITLISTLNTLYIFFLINNFYTHWINYFFFFNFRKSIFKGKRLNIFDVKAATEEAPETGLLRKEQHYFSCIEKFYLS